MSDGESSQGPIIDWLSDPRAHGNPPGGVQRIETHGAFVFLAGARAYKMKRAVKYRYMDYSTLALRRFNLERELTLNRRTAPEIYLRVRCVRRDASGALSMAETAPGETVEWLLEMARFDTEAVLDRIASRGGLDIMLMDRLADAIATGA